MVLTKYYWIFFIIIISSLGGYAFFAEGMYEEINTMLNEILIPSMVGIGILLFVVEAQMLENGLRSGKIKI